MSKKTIPFNGSKADFIQFIKLLESIQVPEGTPNARILTRPEIAALILTFIEFDFGEYPDYETMELCETGESDLVERMLASLDKMGNNIDMNDIIELMKRGPGLGLN